MSWFWKGLDICNNVCEYEVNRLTNEKVIRGKRNVNANCKRTMLIVKVIQRSRS